MKLAKILLFLSILTQKPIEKDIKTVLECLSTSIHKIELILYQAVEAGYLKCYRFGKIILTYVRHLERDIIMRVGS